MFRIEKAFNEVFGIGKPGDMPTRKFLREDTSNTFSHHGGIHDFDSDEDGGEATVLDSVCNKLMNGGKALPTQQQIDFTAKGTKSMAKQQIVPHASVHMKLRFKRRNMEMEDVFHHLMKEFDKDYPIDPMRRPGEKYPTCKKCNGVLWPRPSVSLNPGIMKRLALQLGMRLKVDQFSSTCNGEVEDKVYV